MRTNWSHLRLPLIACLVWAAATWTGAVRAAEPKAPAGSASGTGAEAQQDSTQPPTASPADEAQAAESAEYRIHPGDTIAVTVLGEPQYTGSYTVRPDGTILFSDDMVGTVGVGGRTTQDATDVVAGRIGEFVKGPTIILAISRFNVMVTGEVRRPGQYELASGARLMEAVQKAG
ncbi:MAG: polysaccharide biosynthesis/export family protein, partial [Armatimonadota bacterium]|nr:polysaccharide biosynthesis/export family protein [Armatimonadota bacterium]